MAALDELLALTPDQRTRLRKVVDSPVADMKHEDAGFLVVFAENKRARRGMMANVITWGAFLTAGMAIVGAAQVFWPSLAAILSGGGQ